MPYIFQRRYRLCTGRASEYTLRLRGLMPEVSISDCHLRLSDDQSHVLEYVADAGVDPLRPMVNVDESISVSYTVADVDLFLDLLVPDDASSQAGFGRFELISTGITLVNTGQFLPSECFETQEPNTLNIGTWDMMDRASLIRAGQVIESLYVDMPEALRLAKTMELPGDNFRTVPIDDRPESGIIVHRNQFRTLVYITGTTNRAQLQTQALQMMNGPEYLNGLDTLPIWAGATPGLLLEMSLAGVPADDTPIVIIGHSMGGCIACVAALRLLDLIPSRPISVLSFGSPRPFGAIGRQRLLSQVLVQRHVQNQDDPVPHTAPRRDEIGFLANILPSPVIVTNMNRFRELPGTVALLYDGKLIPSFTTNTLIEQIGPILHSFVGDVPIPVWAQHEMTEYVRRLSLPQ